MLMKITPLGLATLLIVQGWSGVALAESEQPACDQQTLNVVLRKDDPAEFDAYMQHCGDSIKDERGFSVYDRARLAGSLKIAESLVKSGQYNKNSYSKSMGKLIQTGMRFLGFDAGIIDGQLGEASIGAIQRYQKRYGFTADGKLHNDWLADFHRRLIKTTQQQLTDLGFDAGGADGIIGPNTVTAMQAFRQERQMPASDYRDIDDQLLYQLMMLSHEKNKKALAKRDAERAARRAAQEAARRKELAKAREAAQRKAEEQRRAAEAAEISAQQQREAEERRVRLLNIAAQKRVAAELQATKQREQAQNVVEQNQQAAQATGNEQQIKQQAEAAQKKALADAQAKAAAEAEAAKMAQERAAAEQAAALQKAREEAARKASLAAKAAEEQARREAEAAAKAAEQAKSEARKALAAAKKNETVKLSPDMAAATAVQGAKSVGNGFNELRGTLQFSNATSCTVSGQPIESSWCESYYPSGNGKQCTVVMSKSGLVVSFLCD